MTILSLPKIIGCEEFPKSDHGKLLVDDLESFINNQYRFTGKQVLEAFDLAATHSLFMDGKRVDPSTFGKYLSRASVGKVLTAYKESKQSKNARPSMYNPNQLPEYKKENISDADCWELVLKWTKEENKPPFAAPYSGAYRYLLGNNQVPKVKPSKKTSFSDNLDSPQRQAVEKYLYKNVIK